MEEAQSRAGTPPAESAETPETQPAAATCMICGQQKTDGIHILYGFICDSCELEIVRTDVMDDKYAFFVNRMKQIFYKKDA
ncbi:sigma factor G inhibitor Gin [Gordoniibacillus kamchatkensis]